MRLPRIYEDRGVQGLPQVGLGGQTMDIGQGIGQIGQAIETIARIKLRQQEMDDASKAIKAGASFEIGGLDLLNTAQKEGWDPDQIEKKVREYGETGAQNIISSSGIVGKSGRVALQEQMSRAFLSIYKQTIETTGTMRVDRTAKEISRLTGDAGSLAYNLPLTESAELSADILGKRDTFQKYLEAHGIRGDLQKSRLDTFDDEMKMQALAGMAKTNPEAAEQLLLSGKGIAGRLDAEQTSKVIGYIIHSFNMKCAIEDGTEKDMRRAEAEQVSAITSNFYEKTLSGQRPTRPEIDAAFAVIPDGPNKTEYLRRIWAASQGVDVPSDVDAKIALDNFMLTDKFQAMGSQDKRDYVNSLLGKLSMAHRDGAMAAIASGEIANFAAGTDLIDHQLSTSGNLPGDVTPSFCLSFRGGALEKYSRIALGGSRGGKVPAMDAARLVLGEYGGMIEQVANAQVDGIRLKLRAAGVFVPDKSESDTKMLSIVKANLENRRKNMLEVDYNDAMADVVTLRQILEIRAKIVSFADAQKKAESIMAAFLEKNPDVKAQIGKKEKLGAAGEAAVIPFTIEDIPKLNIAGAGP